jgi:hypothetical protein
VACNRHFASDGSSKRLSLAASRCYRDRCVNIGRPVPPIRASRMSIEKFVDEQIRRAIEAGEFDNLTGKGKPIDLSAYFETPEDLRMAYSILKSNNFVPEEVEMLKEIEALKKRLETSSDEEQKSRIKKEITEKTYTFNMLIEKRKRRS